MHIKEHSYWRLTIPIYDSWQWFNIITFLYSTKYSIILTRRKYHQPFNVRTPPLGNLIRKLVSRFEEQGSVADLPVRGACSTLHSDSNGGCTTESMRRSICLYSSWFYLIRHLACVHDCNGFWTQIVRGLVDCETHFVFKYSLKIPE